MRTSIAPFFVYGVPALGLAGLLACLWHPQAVFNPAAMSAPADGPDAVYLLPPSAKFDRSMTMFLRQEARNVAYSRRHDGPAKQTKVIAGYNIVAQECTPAVFQATHLPPFMVF